MSYSHDSIKDIKQKYANIDITFNKFMRDTTLIVSQWLQNEEARRYLLQGVGRRLKILTRCIHNIFEIFPLETKEKLEPDNLTDLTINLHAFMINVYGITDCLAWTFVIEKCLLVNPKTGKRDKCKVGLFKKETQELLGPKLKEYLKSSKSKKWQKEHLTNYRDSLAHKIPLYVPPFVLDSKEQQKYMSLEEQLWDFSPKAVSLHSEIRDKQNELGKPSFAYTDSRNIPMYLHAQVIADFLTIEEIINTFFDDLVQPLAAERITKPPKKG